MSRTSHRTGPGLAKFHRLAGLAEAYARMAFFPRHAGARRHDLPHPLVVSLTSYPARYGVLASTLKCLLDQTVKPDRTVLWIATDEYASLPPSVLDLTRHGLDIRQCANTRSYKKILPPLELWPDSFIVTADDDVWYKPSWLETITRGYDPGKPAIVCRRAHEPTFDADGRVRPYANWYSEVDMEAGDAPRAGLFPTGIGGVLYPPGSLAPEVTNSAAIQELCPDADDIWLYWMGHLAGSRYRQVGGPFRQVAWPRSQRTSLQSQNIDQGRNDVQMAMMQARYGTAVLSRQGAAS